MNHKIEIGRRATSRELLRDDLGAGLVGAGPGRGAGPLRLVEVEIEIGGHKSSGPRRHVRRGDLVPGCRRAVGGRNGERHLPRGAASEHPHPVARQKEDVGAAVEVEILEEDGLAGTGGTGSPRHLAAVEARGDPRHLGRLVEPRLGIELRSIPLDHELQRMPLDGPPVGLRLGDENIGQPPQPPRDAGSIAGVGCSHSLVDDLADVDVGEGLDRRGKGLHRPPARFDLRRQAGGHLRWRPLAEVERQGATPLNHEPQIPRIEFAGPVERRGHDAGASISAGASNGAFACHRAAGPLAERLPALVPGRRVAGSRHDEPARDILPGYGVAADLGDAGREPEVFGRRPLPALHRVECPVRRLNGFLVRFETAVAEGDCPRHGEVPSWKGVAWHLVSQGREGGDRFVERLVLQIPQGDVCLRHERPRALDPEPGHQPRPAPGTDRAPQPPRHRQPHQSHDHQDPEAL